MIKRISMRTISFRRRSHLMLGYRFWSDL